MKIRYERRYNIPRESIKTQGPQKEKVFWLSTGLLDAIEEGRLRGYSISVEVIGDDFYSPMEVVIGLKKDIFVRYIELKYQEEDLKGLYKTLDDIDRMLKPRPKCALARKLRGVAGIF